MRIRAQSFRYAFTLIEMLVVIAVIIILIALITPAIKGARERARDVLCRNRLKELQVATISYAINNGGNLPYSKSAEAYNAAGTPNRWTQSRTGWVDWQYNPHNNNSGTPRPGQVRWWGWMGIRSIERGSLWSYVGKNAKSYGCPEWQRSDVCGKRAANGESLTFNNDTNNFPWRNYAMNRAVSNRDLGSMEASKLMLFSELSNTNFLSDGTTRISDRNMMDTYAVNVECHGWDGDFMLGMVPSRTYPYENVGMYHRGKANAVFVDGHVEAITWQQATNAAAGRW